MTETSSLEMADPLTTALKRPPKISNSIVLLTTKTTLPLTEGTTSDMEWKSETMEIWKMEMGETISAKSKKNGSASMEVWRAEISDSDEKMDLNSIVTRLTE